MYEPILIKTKSLNAYILKTQIFHEIKYDMKGHKRSFSKSLQLIRFWTDFDENLYEC